MMMSVCGSFGCILSWVPTSLPRPRSKRAVAYAVVNAGQISRLFMSANFILSVSILSIGRQTWLMFRFVECVFHGDVVALHSSMADSSAGEGYGGGCCRWKGPFC